MRSFCQARLSLRLPVADLRDHMPPNTVFARIKLSLVSNKSAINKAASVLAERHKLQFQMCQQQHQETKSTKPPSLQYALVHASRNSSRASRTPGHHNFANGAVLAEEFPNSTTAIIQCPHFSWQLRCREMLHVVFSQLSDS